MENINILIIEDETLIALDLSLKVKEFGCNVIDYVTTVSDALEVFQKERIDLLLMDINLNDTIDGIDLYKELNTTIPVIYLSAYTDDKTTNKAIETHPLGYLVKPINEKELFVLLKLARAKLQEYSGQNRDLITLSDGYIFDPVENTLFYQNEKQKLSGKKLDLLKILIDAKGEYVSFEVLENQLYKENPPSESSLRTLVYRLRSLFHSEVIETQRSYGVRLIR